MRAALSGGTVQSAAFAVIIHDKLFAPIAYSAYSGGEGLVYRAAA